MTKHILINGASSGIGRQLAMKLSDLGYQLSLTGRSENKLATTLTQVDSENVVTSQAFCVTDETAVKTFCDSASEVLPIDILINCVGLNNSREAGHLVPIETLNWQMQVNCYAPIRFMQACIPAMQNAKQGTVINVLSTTCLYSNTNIAAYTASKAAIDAYTKVMRKELREDGIKMLSIYPGGVDTDFRDVDRPQYLTAEDVADAIIYMLQTNDKTHVHELVLRPQTETNFA
ncbi:short-chain dehydrogenase [Saccharobesus litoralis]|uniref:Short-chain dehydrogenase n=1 Tax=Saccharobesus litoralis TaxID=2172099 RepID=A0A2S0VLQ2_9ALTE|nr:SDR family NAD(P)-dependent oxidoreductase [Saccharobesus litoralis]AWB65133.1 short-chain dehydrogenase [Saccharobesus litoralis]